MDISIIICSHNGEKTIRECLSSLNNQELVDNRSIQIILIDSGSTDLTHRLMNDYKSKNQKLNYYIDVFQLEKPGQSLAINSAIKYAHGRMLLFTDDDCLLDPKWIYSYYEAFININNASYLFGRIIPRAESHFPSWWNLAPRSLSGRHQGDNIKTYNVFSKESYPIGCNMAINKKLLDKYNLSFDEDLGPSPLNKVWLGAETKLGSQFIRCGGFCCYVPQAIVYHWIRSSRIKLSYLIKHYFVSGRASFYYRSETRGVPEIILSVFIKCLYSLKSLFLMNIYEFKKHILQCSKEIGCLVEVSNN